MTQSSDLETRLCLVWTTEKPHLDKPRKSSSFTLLDAEWNLYMAYSCTGAQYITLYLRQESKREKLEKCFRVTTFIEDVEHGCTSLNCTRDVQTTYEIIWQFNPDRVAENIPDCYYSGHWRIVCLFHSDLMSKIQGKNGMIQLSVRNDLDSLTTVDLRPDLESLSTDFSNMLKNKVFPDVKLQCGDDTIHAHRAVLAARSEVFAAMFRNEMTENETRVVNVTDMDLQTLDLLLKYLYSGRLQDLLEDAVPSLYVASDKYTVHSLKKACSDRIIRNLTEDNCVSFLIIADAHGDVAFKDSVISFICDHEDVLDSEAWIKFSDKHCKLSNGVYQRVFRIKRRKLEPINEDITINNSECNNISTLECNNHLPKSV